MAVNIGRGRTNVTRINWLGLDMVLKNLNKQTGVIQNKTRRGMTIVVLKIRRDAQILTPVDKGNLRASAYTIVGGGIKKPSVGETNVSFSTKDRSGRKVAADHRSVIDSKKKPQKDPYGIIGYTAHYALAVHERLSARHFGKARGAFKEKLGSIQDAQIGQAKFLEEALNKNNKFIIKTLRETARI